jgi:hypothetical protein
VTAGTSGSSPKAAGVLEATASTKRQSALAVARCTYEPEPVAGWRFRYPWDSTAGRRPRRSHGGLLVSPGSSSCASVAPLGVKQQRLAIDPHLHPSKHGHLRAGAASLAMRAASATQQCAAQDLPVHAAAGLESAIWEAGGGRHRTPARQRMQGWADGSRVGANASSGDDARVAPFRSQGSVAHDRNERVDQDLSG